MNDDDYNEIINSIERFEDMINNGTNCFFDLHELEDIIDYYMDIEDYDKASQATEFAIRTYPNSEIAQQRMCEILLDHGSSSEALDILDKLSQIDDKDPETFLLKGEALLQMGETLKAIEDFNKGFELSLKSDKPEAAYRVGLLLIRAEQYPTAIKFLEQSYELCQDDEMLFFDLANCYDKLNDFPKSIEFFNKYLDIHPFSVQGWFGLGMAYSRMGESDKAISSFDYCLAIDPSCIIALHSKAKVYTRLEKFSEAIDQYKLISIIEPNNAVIYGYMADNYELMGEIETAGEYLQHALDIEPDNAMLLLRMFLYKLSVGLKEEALPYFVKGWDLATEEEKDNFAMHNYNILNDKEVKSIINS